MKTNLENVSLEHKKEAREAEVGDLGFIEEMNETMRIDEIAKESSGETGRLDTGRQRQRQRQTERGKIGLYIFLNCFHEFFVLFPQPENSPVTRYILLKTFTLPLFPSPGVPNDPDPA